MRIEDFGLSPKTVLRFLEAAGELDSLYSVTVVKDGQVLLDSYFEPFHRELRRDLYSVSKSIVSLAVGVAVDCGKLSLEDHLIDFFKDELPDRRDERIRDITIRNMLNMSSSSAYTSGTFRGKDCNWKKLYLGLPLPGDPGSAFHYDTGSPYMLANIVSRVMGQPCDQVLKQYVFGPMGIRDCVWSRDPDGHITGGWDCFMRAEDYTKLGGLILNLGMWGNRRLISREYMEEATSKLICTVDDPGVGWCYGYGFLFWRWPDDTFGCFGAFGQLIVCSRKKNMYVATTAGLSVEENRRLALIIIETLVGEAGSGPLPRDDVSYPFMEKALKGRSLPCPEGKAASGACEREAFGVTYRFPGNDSHIESICLERADRERLRVELRYDGRMIRFDAGFGAWISTKAVFDSELLNDHAFAYGWKTEGELVIRHCLLNTAYRKDYCLAFRAGKAVCTVRQNVVLPGLGDGITFESV